LNVPVYIFHLGDFDPSGVCAAEKIDKGLREHAPKAEIHFERLAVTEQQIEDWRLPSRPTKTTDTPAKKLGRATAVEHDAINPIQLPDLVKAAIERHQPAHELEVMKAAEEDERKFLGGLVGFMEQAGKFSRSNRGKP